MQEPKCYSMEASMVVSGIGISVSTKYLKDVLKYPEIINVEDNTAMQKKDIDLVAFMEDDANGAVRGATIEVKTDQYTSGNLYFETLSCVERKTPGCLMYSEADWLHYYFVGFKHLYIMDMRLFRDWTLRNRHRYNPAPTSTKRKYQDSKLYTSEGLLIPLRDVRSGFSEFRGKYVDAAELGLI